MANTVPLQPPSPRGARRTAGGGPGRGRVVPPPPCTARRKFASAAAATYVCASADGTVPGGSPAAPYLRRTRAATMRDERKKVWIDGFQTKLFLRMGTYWLIYQLGLWNLVFVWRLLHEGPGN